MGNIFEIAHPAHIQICASKDWIMVQGVGFRVPVLGIGVECSGFSVQGLGSAGITV